MRPPSIVAFGPRRPWARPGESITVDVELALDPRLSAEFAVALGDLDREIVKLNGHAPPDTSGTDGSRRRCSVDVSLPSAVRHGYGLRLRASAGGRTALLTSAVEAIDGWWQSPRHAALTEFRDPAASAAAVRDLVGWHVTVAQHYDWMWRHYRYRPRGQAFVDALGRNLAGLSVPPSMRATTCASCSLRLGLRTEPEYVQQPTARVRRDGGRSAWAMFYQRLRTVALRRLLRSIGRRPRVRFRRHPHGHLRSAS
jgi:hypothetical protein